MPHSFLNTLRLLLRAFLLFDVQQDSSSILSSVLHKGRSRHPSTDTGGNWNSVSLASGCKHIACHNRFVKTLHRHPCHQLVCLLQSNNSQEMRKCSSIWIGTDDKENITCPKIDIFACAPVPVFAHNPNVLVQCSADCSYCRRILQWNTFRQIGLHNTLVPTFVLMQILKPQLVELSSSITIAHFHTEHV